MLFQLLLEQALASGAVLGQVLDVNCLALEAAFDKSIAELFGWLRSRRIALCVAWSKRHEACDCRA